MRVCDVRGCPSEDHSNGPADRRVGAFGGYPQHRDPQELFVKVEVNLHKLTHAIVMHAKYEFDDAILQVALPPPLEGGVDSPVGRWARNRRKDTLIHKENTLRVTLRTCVHNVHLSG